MLVNHGVNVRGLYRRQDAETPEGYQSNSSIQQAVDAIIAAVPGVERSTVNDER